jgi:DNA invertase Pin-like site-specific DNA recombinase
MKKAGIYCRVSTSDQNVDMQLADLRSYAEARGFEIYDEYIDHGFSGTKEHRPALDRLMSDARKKKFNTVLVWRFDRFARSVRHLVTALYEFKHLNITFISHQESIDLSSPIGQAMYTIISAMAQLERDLISEKVKSGMRRARQKGKQLGRPRIEIDPEKVMELKDQGMSMRKISQLFNVNRGTIRIVLDRCTADGSYSG